MPERVFFVVHILTSFFRMSGSLISSQISKTRHRIRVELSFASAVLIACRCVCNGCLSHEIGSRPRIPFVDKAVERCDLTISQYDRYCSHVINSLYQFLYTILVISIDNSIFKSINSDNLLRTGTPRWIAVALTPKKLQILTGKL